MIDHFKDIVRVTYEDIKFVKEAFELGGVPRNHPNFPNVAIIAMRILTTVLMAGSCGEAIIALKASSLSGVALAVFSFVVCHDLFMIARNATRRPNEDVSVEFIGHPTEGTILKPFWDRTRFGTYCKLV